MKLEFNLIKIAFEAPSPVSVPKSNATRAEEFWNEVFAPRHRDPRQTPCPGVFPNAAMPKGNEPASSNPTSSAKRSS